MSDEKERKIKETQKTIEYTNSFVEDVPTRIILLEILDYILKERKKGTESD